MKIIEHMAKYFVFSEFTKSDTAKSLGIDNTPVEDTIKDNIIELMRLMDRIREKWTEYCKQNYLPNPQIIITSGYRCDALNKALKGSKTSAHRIGSACDFEAKNGRNKELFKVVLDLLCSENIMFEELINENNYSWIHLAVKNIDGEQKKEVFSL